MKTSLRTDTTLKMKAIHYTLIITAALLAASCAEEIDESAESVQERILKAYVEKYYPDAVRSESGLYYIEQTPGTGRTPQESSYVLVEYTITYLDGSYNSYTSDSIAKQIGSYSYSGYYDPRIWSLENSTPGVVELLTGMQEGGYVKAIVPATLLDEESGLEITEGDGSSKIYEIHLLEVIDNVDRYEIRVIEDYVMTKIPDIRDSTEYGLYFHKIREGASIDTVKDEDHTYYRYIGRFLNGTVFDTNIEDTARKYRIFNGDADSYTSSSFQYFTDEDEVLENNSLVQGFTKALWRMGRGDQAVVVFYSKLGYGEDGKGSIPGYVPLRFDIWVDEDDE